MFAVCGPAPKTRYLRQNYSWLSPWRRGKWCCLRGVRRTRRTKRGWVLSSFVRGRIRAATFHYQQRAQTPRSKERQANPEGASLHGVLSGEFRGDFSKAPNELGGEASRVEGSSKTLEVCLRRAAVVRPKVSRASRVVQIAKQQQLPFCSHTAYLSSTCFRPLGFWERAYRFIFRKLRICCPISEGILPRKLIRSRPAASRLASIVTLPASGTCCSRNSMTCFDLDAGSPL